MPFKYKCLLIISPLVLALDQFTKYLVSNGIELGKGISVIPGFFDIVHYTNNGAAFGMFAGAEASWRTPFFYVISALALVAIIMYIIKLPEYCSSPSTPLGINSVEKRKERLVPVALSLVIGGIFGNGIDRFRFGAVTDFLSVHLGDKVLWGVRLEWPAFNVADSAITIAMVLLIFGAFRKR